MLPFQKSSPDTAYQVVATECIGMSICADWYYAQEQCNVLFLVIIFTEQRCFSFLFPSPVILTVTSCMYQNEKRRGMWTTKSSRLVFRAKKFRDSQQKKLSSGCDRYDEWMLEPKIVGPAEFTEYLSSSARGPAIIVTIRFIGARFAGWKRFGCLWNCGLPYLNRPQQFIGLYADNSRLHTA